MRPAVFLDRDGTIIKNVPYLNDPARVELIDGAADGIRLLRRAGYACVIVTNQSAIGRRMLSNERFAEIQAELRHQLQVCGTQIDGTFVCPEIPLSSDRTVVECADRKPGPGMLLRAAAELQLDVARSWMVGDMISDVYAGKNAGCYGTILVGMDPGVDEAADGAADHVVQTMLEAACLIIRTAARVRINGAI